MEKVKLHINIKYINKEISLKKYNCREDISLRILLVMVISRAEWKKKSKHLTSRMFDLVAFYFKTKFNFT